MHSFDVARSFAVYPLIGAFWKAGIGRREAAELSGLPAARITEIQSGTGAEANLEEIARLAAVVGYELSVVPAEAGSKSFTEMEAFPAHREPSGGYARRVVEMIDKVTELCVDLRLSTGLPSGAFERMYAVDDGLVKTFADPSSSGSVTLDRAYAYLNRFGAALGCFPRSSAFTNYYRAMVEVAAPACDGKALKAG